MTGIACGAQAAYQHFNQTHLLELKIHNRLISHGLGFIFAPLTHEAGRYADRVFKELGKVEAGKLVRRN